MIKGPACPKCGSEMREKLITNHGQSDKGFVCDCGYQRTPPRTRYKRGKRVDRHQAGFKVE